MDGGCYLMRIGVRAKCQRQGVGRQLMDYLFERYPHHLSLDVSTDNTKAVRFYERVGLHLAETYLSEEKVEFAKFETPPDFVAPPKRTSLIAETKKTVDLDNLSSMTQSSSPGHKSEADADVIPHE